MTPRTGIIGGLATHRWLGNPWLRRALLLVLVALLVLLALFPRQYRAYASLTPTDPAALGLGGALGQFSAIGNVFGNQAAVEIGLKVGRSQQVRATVAKTLDLSRRLNERDPLAVDRWLEREVTIRSLRGGILQIETKQPDAEFSEALVAAFTNAIRDRLAAISRNQTEYKRKILEDLVSDAGARLSRAQSAYDNFRRRTRYASPGPSISAIGARIPQIQAAIKAREVDLRAARRFATDENIAVQQILAQIAALRTQLAEAESLDASEPDSVNRVVIESTQVQNLERDLGIARTLFDSYRRYLEGTAVEDLVATGNVRMLEPATIDSARQFNTLPAALALLLILAGAAIELYRIRPPIGSRPAPQPAE